MPTTKRPAKQTAHGAERAAANPYAPSWIDRLVDFIEGLPIPNWSFYVLAFLAISLVEMGLLWARGVFAFPQVDRVYLVSLFWTIAQVIMFHYLRSAAAHGIQSFRKALAMNDTEFAELRYRFTILPARTGWLITLAAIVIAIAGGEGFREYIGVQMFAWPNALLTWPLAVLLLAVLMAFLVRAARTYWLASRLYSYVTAINMFDLSPLYGLSSFSYRMGMFTVVLAFVSLFTNSAFITGSSTASADSVFFMVLDVMIGLAAFLFPLLGLHRRLVAEKQKLASGNAAQLKRVFEQLQARIATGKSRGLAELRTSAAALVDYREEIKKLPTWPWDTGTLQRFVTALLLPLTLWGIQQLLLRTLVK